MKLTKNGITYEGDVEEIIEMLDNRRKPKKAFEPKKDKSGGYASARKNFISKRAKQAMSQYQMPYEKAIAMAAQEWNERSKPKVSVQWRNLKEEDAATVENIAKDAIAGRPITYAAVSAATSMPSREKWAEFVIDFINNAPAICKKLGVPDKFMIKQEGNRNPEIWYG